MEISDDEIAQLLSDINPNPYSNSSIVNDSYGYLCPNCKVPTKRLRVSNPKRENRKLSLDTKTGNYIQPTPMDLHLRIIDKANMTTHNFVLSTGFTLCFQCRTSWYE